MTLRNPFKKKPEKRAAAPVRPAPAPASYDYLTYAPAADPAPSVRPDACDTGSSSSHHGGSSGHAAPSHDHGSHSSHTSHDFGSHSFGGHDSGSSGCDSGGGF